MRCMNECHPKGVNIADAHLGIFLARYIRCLSVLSKFVEVLLQHVTKLAIHEHNEQLGIVYTEVL